MRLDAGQGRFENSREFAAAAADEDGVRSGQLCQSLRGLPNDNVDMGDRELAGILSDVPARLAVLFHGPHRQPRNQPGRLDADGAAARADVPQDVARMKFQGPQGKKPNLPCKRDLTVAVLEEIPSVQADAVGRLRSRFALRL